MSGNNHFHYDLCIVGAGMVGSAAARYASAYPGTKVCLIGPTEPKQRVSTRGDEIFGTHYDNGRSACLSDHVDPFWGEIARVSISKFRQLEEMSGIDFYHQVGNLSVGCKEFMDKRRNKDFIKLSKNDLSQRFGYMKFADDDNALLDTRGGWINPRKLIDAEIIMASKQGCDIVREVVSEINHVSTNGMTVYELCTDSGAKLRSKRVLLATNVFTMHRRLLPKHIVPKFYASPQTVVMGEVDEDDLDMLSNFPSIVYHGEGSTRWYKDYPRNKDGNIHFYGSSIMKYPDGKHYIKIGHSDDILERYLGLSEVSRWFCSGGDHILTQHLTQLLKTMFTGLKFLSFKSDACVTMVTATGRPYIDKVKNNFGVAIGGNGRAAKSSDAIGCLAARMILDRMDENDTSVQKRCKLVTETREPASKL